MATELKARPQVSLADRASGDGLLLEDVSHAYGDPGEGRVQALAGVSLHAARGRDAGRGGPERLRKDAPCSS